MNRTIVFDLDGTLVDSNRDLIPALNKTIATKGLPPLAREDVGHVVGQGAVMMIRKAFQFHGASLDEAEIPDLLELYLEIYEAHIADETVFFENCLEALDELSAHNWLLAVCTNKFEHLARKLLAELGEIKRFPTITGGDTFPFKKPDPNHILKTIELAGGVPERAVMVGDSNNDIAAAKAADIPSIAVTFGYTDTPVKELEPVVIIDNFDELAAAANTLMPD